MAIIPSLPGLDVSVEVNGDPLVEEYDDDEDNERVAQTASPNRAPKAICKYVECTTGAAFKVKVLVREPFKLDCPTLSFHFYVDEVQLSRNALSFPGSKLRELDWCYAAGYQVDQGTFLCLKEMQD